MLDASVLRESLEMLVKGNCDVVLYGTKSCGKTSLAKDVLDTAIGQDKYIHIKGMLVSNRNTFISLFNQELLDILEDLDEKFMQSGIASSFKKEETSMTITGWVSALNQLGEGHEELFSQIKRLYVLIDNFEELHFRENFFCKFYQAAKKNLHFLKISFFFTGMNHPDRMLSDEEPFRHILSFFMPKPDVKAVIEEQIKKCLENRNICIKQFLKLVYEMKQILLSSFDFLEVNINTIKRMVELVMKETIEFIKQDPLNVAIWLESKELSEVIKKLMNYGPVTTERFMEESCRKFQGIKEIVEGDDYFIHEGYANLILSSIYLINGYSEEDDRIRFRDYYSHRRKRGRKMKYLMNSFKKANQSSNQFMNHNLQRVIAISEIIESESAADLLKDKEQCHHNLDYYGCFQYLKDEGKIGLFGILNRPYGGKIYGDAKESEVRDFLKQIEIEQSQFMP